MRRLEGESKTPYIFAFLTAIFPMFWILIYDSGLSTMLEIIFLLVCLVGMITGAIFGHKAGLKAQIEFKEKLIEYLRNTGQLPEGFEDRPQQPE